MDSEKCSTTIWQQPEPALSCQKFNMRVGATMSEEQFEELYSVGLKLGNGGFGVVKSGIRMSDQLQVAIKSVPKNSQVVILPSEKTNEEDRLVPIEVVLMLKTIHIPGVIKFIDFHDLPDCYKIVMERFGTTNSVEDLFDFITHYGAIKEDLARFIFQQIVDIAVLVKAAGVVHRDIKDENILIDIRTFRVKLIDFGSGAIHHDELYYDFDGTRVYAPPEWFRFRRYQADGLTVWSLGILLFNMVCGNIPFETNDEIKKAILIYKKSIKVSECLKNLIRACLTVSPIDRIKLDAIQEHPWMQSGVEVSTAEKSSLERTKSLPMNVVGAPLSISNGPPKRNDHIEMNEKSEEFHLKENCTTFPTNQFPTATSDTNNFFIANTDEETEASLSPDRRQTSPLGAASPSFMPMSISPLPTSFNATNYDQIVENSQPPKYPLSESCSSVQSLGTDFSA